MMHNHYRMHRWRSLRCWVIVGAICVMAYAGCADSAAQRTNLAIDNLRVDTIADGVITVAFTINQPADIFWTLYAHNAPAPDDINAVISDAYSSSSDPMIVRNGVQIERSDTNKHTIKLANLPGGRSYNLYVAATNTHGSLVLADVLPITIIRNISDIDITRINNETIQINWKNPSAHTSRILEKIVIDWNATNHDGERAASGSYSATHVLTADAKASAILSILPTKFIEYQFSLTARYRDGSRLAPFTMSYRPVIDNDGDGLIDIYTLEALNNIRYNPEGTAYQAIGLDGNCSGAVIRCGVDGASACSGYELRRDLNFSEGASYATGTVNPNWRPNNASDSNGRLTTANRGQNRGWIPIESIAATFEGNGHTIENLYTRDTSGRNYQLSGLFGRVNGNTASIRNLTLKSAFVYGGSGIGSHVGALAGELNGGTIENVAVIGGMVDGVGGSHNRVGGLVGQNADAGAIRNSYATATVHGSPGERDYVGGLVGHNASSETTVAIATGAYWARWSSDYVSGFVDYNSQSTITASHATGNVNGGDGDHDKVGGLVGRNWSGTITASYATGNVDGGYGIHDRVGGLVGHGSNSAIVASYATGNVYGGGGAGESVGGLAGRNWFGTISASYATGDVYGGYRGHDCIGGLVGIGNDLSTITASYATGHASIGTGAVVSLTDALIGCRNSWRNSTIKDSYGFGGGGRIHNSPLPSDASRASDLTTPVASNAPNTAVPEIWDSAAERSKGAWDFGTSTQRPALRYADYDGDGDAYSCDQFPAPCGTLIPGQR